jgi:hypothetical protein
MKKLIALLCAFTPTLVSAQNWVDLGAKGSYGVNLLYNQNWFDSGDFSQLMGTGYSFGGKFGFNFGPDHEATFEMLSSKFSQDFKYDQAISPYDQSLSFNTLDYLLMYRKNNEGSYFEIGPQISVLKNITASNSDPDIGNQDVSSYLNDKYTSAVVGFGSYFFGTDNVGVTFGFRFKYALDDLISNEGQASSVHYVPGPAVEYSSYRATHPFVAELVCEINWDLGYMAKAKCGQRRKLMMF